MGGNNMESILMGADDSSDDSDGDNDLSNVPTAASAVAATIQPTASPTPPQQQPPVAVPASAPPPSQGPLSSQQEQRKFLYSQSNHAKKQLPPAPAPAPQQPTPQHHQPPQQMPPSSQHHHPGMPQPAPIQQRTSSSQSRPPQSAQRITHPGASPSYTSPPVVQPPPQQRYPSSSSQPPPQAYQQPPSSYPRSPSGHHPSSSSGHPQHPGVQPPQRSSTAASTSGGVPNPVPHGAVPPPGQRRSAVSSSLDPFEPTPLHKIKEREQQAAAAAAASRSSSGYPSSTSGGSGGVPPSASASAVEREKEMRRQKERFLMFTRVLMKYLETKDPALHSKVKSIIKDCAERNKRQERGYESVTASMRERLKHVVGDAYWKRAESYLAHFLAQKQKAAGGAGKPPPPGGSGAATAVVDPQRQQQQQSELAKRKQQEEIERRRRAQQMAQQQQQQQVQQQKLEQQRKMQQQQQQAQQQPPPQQQQQQQPPPAQPPQAAPAPAPTPSKASRTASTAAGAGGGKGKRASGKQATGKTTKKARTSKSTTTSRGSKTVSTGAQSPTAATAAATPTSQPSHATPSSTPMAVDTSRPPSPPPVREYSELMEAVDHAVNFDWTTAGLIMGSAVQKQQLQEEQKNLLYGSSSKPITTTTINPNAMDWAPESPAAVAPTTATEGGVPFALRGWGKRNLVSPRVAWSRVRRREQPTAEAQRRYQALYPDAPPIPTPPTAWLHEDKAEDDAVLCLLSEATQIYVSQILQKALVCARQRQNLDGIRLWHQQCTAAMEITKAVKDPDVNKEKPIPPALSIRLGCDVSRQVARTMGNAALTCKRMEEALERQKTEQMTRVVPAKTAPTLNAATLASAQSMGELSLLPPMAKASEKADYEAKRAFEIYGGKHSREPPFGRVPKKAVLEVADFQQGVQLNNFLGGRGNRRHRANPHAFSFAQG